MPIRRSDVRLQLAFETQDLRDTCKSEEKAKDQLGAPLAERLQQCLADLRAAETIEDLPLVDHHRADGTCVLSLSEKARVIVRHNHTNAPQTEAGTIDWSRVRRIRVMEIQCDD